MRRPSHDVKACHAVGRRGSGEEEGCYPLNVTFANVSTGGDQFEWSYGTGLNSTETVSEHTVAYYNPTSNVVPTRCPDREYRCRMQQPRRDTWRCSPRWKPN